MSINRKESPSKYAVLNVKTYQWVWKVYFHYSPLNFHVHTGEGEWAAACVCENFHEIREVRNYTDLSFSENRYSFTTDTHTFKKQSAKTGTNLTSKICPVRRKNRATHSEKRWRTHQRHTQQAEETVGGNRSLVQNFKFSPWIKVFDYQ